MSKQGRPCTSTTFASCLGSKSRPDPAPSYAAPDRFLGSWSVLDYVFTPDGSYLGTVQQLRQVREQPGTDQVLVTQTCAPSEELAMHPLAAFCGEFSFVLRRIGDERHYLGPDVHGHATAFGGMYLCGQGVWPRFAQNFRSWSISLSETEQLTGCQYFRGGQTTAVVFGIGQRVGEPVLQRPSSADVSAPLHLANSTGWITTLHTSTNNEDIVPLRRKVLDTTHWEEHSGEREDHFSLVPKGQDYCVWRNGKAVGMAKAYGPLLSWETHGGCGESTTGVEIAAGSARHFSIRQNYRSGRLLSLQGLSLTLQNQDVTTS